MWDGDHDLVRQVEAAADAGFDGIGIDIWSIDHHLSSGRPIDEIAAALARTGLPCVELQALVIHEEATTLQDIERFAALADVLRPEVVMVGMGGTDDARVDLLRQAGEVVGQGGARLAVEFIPVGEVRDIATTLDVTRRAGGPVGVCLDTWHFFRGTDTWADLDGLPGEEIAHVQFDDAPPLVSDDLMSEMVHRRVLPGRGRVRPGPLLPGGPGEGVPRPRGRRDHLGTPAHVGLRRLRPAGAGRGAAVLALTHPLDGAVRERTDRRRCRLRAPPVTGGSGRGARARPVASATT